MDEKKEEIAEETGLSSELESSETEEFSAEEIAQALEESDIKHEVADAEEYEYFDEKSETDLAKDDPDDKSKDIIVSKAKISIKDSGSKPVVHIPPDDDETLLEIKIVEEFTLPEDEKTDENIPIASNDDFTSQNFDDYADEILKEREEEDSYFLEKSALDDIDFDESTLKNFLAVEAAKDNIPGEKTRDIIPEVEIITAEIPGPDDEVSVDEYDVSERFKPAKVTEIGPPNNLPELEQIAYEMPESFIKNAGRKLIRALHNLAFNIRDKIAKNEPSEERIQELEREKERKKQIKQTKLLMLKEPEVKPTKKLSLDESITKLNMNEFIVEEVAKILKEKLRKRV